MVGRALERDQVYVGFTGMVSYVFVDDGVSQVLGGFFQVVLVDVYAFDETGEAGFGFARGRESRDFVFSSGFFVCRVYPDNEGIGDGRDDFGVFPGEVAGIECLHVSVNEHGLAGAVVIYREPCHADFAHGSEFHDLFGFVGIFYEFCELVHCNRAKVRHVVRFQHYCFPG